MQAESVSGNFISLHHGGLLGFQDVVSEDPGHGHLNRELDAATHGQLQEELSEPQLGQVAALLQGLWRVDGHRQGGEHKKMWARTRLNTFLQERLQYVVVIYLIFTAEVEQVSEEEGLLVEVFYGHHYRPIQTAAKSLLRAALVCYQ